LNPLSLTDPAGKHTLSAQTVIQGSRTSMLDFSAYLA